MAYKDAAQFDRAAKKGIRESGRDAGNAYREMLRDRFHCRVFAGGGERFVLKGGSDFLARIPDARKTRDLLAGEQIAIHSSPSGLETPRSEL